MRAIAIVFVLSTVMLPTVALAEVPDVINYQGTLTDENGVALDDTVSMTFSIYAEPIGDSLLWIETQPAVVVSGGLFNVLLGEVNALGEAVFNGSSCWLEIQVEADPPMQPRQRIGSVTFAFRAARADTAEYAHVAVSDGDWVISGNHMYSAVPGSVGVGTSSPAAKLDVRGTVNVGQDDTGHDVNFYGQYSGGRFFWNQEKMALRFGRDDDGTHWLPDSVGFYSLASGYNTKALGNRSTALGHKTTARSNYSTALGYETTARGENSMALGRNTTTLGYGSLAAGRGTIAGGDYSTALGWETSTSGDYSMAMGFQTAASGFASVALGTWLRAGPANCTITMGRGVSVTDSLVNNVENSLMVGFNTNTPTMFVGGSDHRVGVGTSAPGEKLDVNGTARVTGFSMPTGATEGYILTTDGAGVGTWQPTAVVSDSDWTISGDDLYSAVSGNIGIGTTSPLARLHVEEDSTADLLRIRQAGQTKFIVRNDGNVGIGSLTPLFKLEVVGDAAFSEHLYHNGDVDTYLRFTTDQVDLSAGGVQMITADESAQDVVVINKGGTDVDFRVKSVPDSNALFVRGSDGNVAIGTTILENTKLHVLNTGSGRAGHFQIQNAGNDSAALYATTNGTGQAVYAKNITSGNYGVIGSSWNGVAGLSTSGDGVYGKSSNGNGVYGFSSDGYGVFGFSDSSSITTYGYLGGGSIGAYGRHNPNGNSGYMGGADRGVYGYGSNGIGVYGLHGDSGNYGYLGGAIHGVYGYSSDNNGGVFWSDSGYGVYGYSAGGTGVRAWTDTGYAGWFWGNVNITGTLSKGGGSFVIDHPLDPENKLLRHNFVESPENLLIYRGKTQLDANGQAVVEMPDYFAALTREDQATINLTPIGRSRSKERFEFSYEWRSDHRAFQIFGEPNREVSWMVMADRDDPVIHQLARPVEEDKGPDNKLCDRGELLYPTAYGYPESMGKDYKEREEMKRHEQEALR